MEDKEYVVILDTYFEKRNTKKGIYFRISDEELAKLCIKVKNLEFEKEQVIRKYTHIYNLLNNRIIELKDKVHTYKVELGRYRRKLTRIYNLFNEIRKLLILQYWAKRGLSDMLKTIDEVEKEIRNV